MITKIILVIIIVISTVIALKIAVFFPRFILHTFFSKPSKENGECFEKSSAIIQPQYDS